MRSVVAPGVEVVQATAKCNGVRSPSVREFTSTRESARSTYNVLTRTTTDLRDGRIRPAGGAVQRRPPVARARARIALHLQETERHLRVVVVGGAM